MSKNKRNASDTFREMNERLTAKRQGKSKEKGTKRKNELIVQRLASDVSGKAQKYVREGPRVFEPFPVTDEELTIDLIKRACEDHFSEQIGPNFECNVLAGQQGPSCTSIDQLPDIKLVHVRFVPSRTSRFQDTKSNTEFATWKRARRNPVDVGDNLPHHSRSYAAKSEVAEPVGKARERDECVPMSLSLTDMLRLGKLGTPNQTTVVKMFLFDLETLTWGQVPIIMDFQEGRDPIGTGAFRSAYKAKTKHAQFSAANWVIKRYLQRTIDGIHTLGQTLEQHTRKVVQMHLLARNFASQLEKRIMKNHMQSAFGKFLKYNNIYYSEVEGETDERKFVTIEEFIEGQFRKYINNNGERCVKGSDIVCEKAECLAHFSYEKSEKLILVDIQGCGHDMCDPEIASAELHYSEEQGDDPKEFLYCAGNMSTQAIGQFVKSHKCNVFCELAGLQEFEARFAQSNLTILQFSQNFAN